MERPSPAARGFFGNLAGPAAAGLAFGLAHTAALKGPWPPFSLQGPFTFSVLSGVAVALACRPVLARVPWRRGAALAVALALLVGIGPAAGRALALGVVLVKTGGGASGSDGTLWPALWAAVAGAVVMGLLFPPREGAIGAASIRARLAKQGNGRWLARIFLLGLGAVVLWVLLGWWDAARLAAAGTGRAALVSPNAFSALAEALLPGHGVTSNGASPHPPPGDWAGAWWLLLMFWGRGVALFLPLGVVCLTIRGAGWQLALVLGILLFVVGDFAPLILDQPYTSTVWLLQRLGLGLVRAFVLALAAALVLGLPRLPKPEA